MIRFAYIKALFSPFKRPKLKWYVGKVRVGTPIFFPRRWVKHPDKPGYKKAIPRKIGFDWVRLGWKTKWSATDYRFEWAPMVSFVFFKWQRAIMVQAPYQDHYWRCWLYYYLNTDKKLSKKQRIKQCREDFPCIWTTHGADDKTKRVDYYNLILKKKWIE